MKRLETLAGFTDELLFFSLTMMLVQSVHSNCWLAYIHSAAVAIDDELSA